MAEILKSSFSQVLVELNQLNFKCWIFQRGMEFGSQEKWWGATGSRLTKHEGLDFRCYKDRNGKLVNLAEKTIVPVMYDGKIIKIFADLLGYSVLVEHVLQDKGKKLCSIYAHTLPVATLKAGSRVKVGEPIAEICATGKKSIRPHLHLSVIWALESAIVDLDWKSMHKEKRVTFCNPLDFLFVLK
jgi:murein DD-endopeptidase MepM/ murein hydrolase activator NlpD